ncbi:MAG: C_GCAxxG_C_C family protein [Clostridiales bacterium]|nr:C_GCAxxG_C_C family protein [Clostridiales bacterium]
MLILSTQQRIEKATSLFSHGYSCSQAVLCAYLEDFSLTTNTAKGISAAFSGGMRQGETCGAISGSFMVMGLYSYELSAHEPAQKALCAYGVAQYILALENQNIPSKCKDL